MASAMIAAQPAAATCGVGNASSRHNNNVNGRSAFLRRTRAAAALPQRRSLETAGAAAAGEKLTSCAPPPRSRVRARGATAEYETSTSSPTYTGIKGKYSKSRDVELEFFLPFWDGNGTACVVGEHDALGNWDAELAVPLLSAPVRFEGETWRGKVNLPKHVDGEYKIIVRIEGEETRWMPGDNLHLPEAEAGAIFHESPTFQL